MSKYRGYRGKRSNPYNICLLYASLILFVIASATYLFVPYARFLAQFFCGLGIISLLTYLLGLVPSYATLGTLACYLRRVLLCGFVLWLLSFIVVETMIAAHAKTSADSENADYLIVLGAGLYGTTPSPSLTSRLDAALEYAENNPGTILIVTGGQGAGEDITEAEAMRTYLIDRNLPPERILEEPNAMSTTENLRFSFGIIDRVYQTNETLLDNPKIAVLSNEFHLYRAGVIAEKEGRDVALVSAPTPMLSLKVTYYVREYFALLKSVFFD